MSVDFKNTPLSTAGAVLLASVVAVGGTLAGITIGSTTITSTMAAKLDREVERVAYPEDFLAAGIDGGVATDYTAAIQAAANSLAPDGGVAGGTVKFRSRPYVISSLITIPSPVEVEGDALPFVTNAFIESPATNSGTVLLSAQLSAFNFLKLGHRCAVRRVNFDALTTPGFPTAGAVIDLSGAGGVRIENVGFNRCWRCIVSDNASQTPQSFEITSAKMLNVRDAGVYLNNAVHGKIEDLTVINLDNAVNNSFFHASRGIHMIGGTATIKVRGALFDYLEDGIRIAGGAPGVWTRVADDIDVQGVTFDVIGRTSLALSNVVHSTFNGNHFISGVQWDIYMEDSSSALVINGNTFANTTKTPISLTSTGLVDTSITGNTFIGSATAGSPYNVISVAAGVSYFNIAHNTLSLADAAYGTTAGQAVYFVDIATGASDHFSVVGNVGSGVTGVVNDGSSGEDKRIVNP